MNAFISYSWDSDEHKDWVRDFADALISNGVAVTLDQYDLNLGDDQYQFMEHSVANADVVLCVCSPAYVDRANGREKGVGVETSLITPQSYNANKTKQFIPIVRHSEADLPSTPDYMSGLIYVDFRTDENFKDNLEEVLRHLHQQPRHVKPELGAIPDFGSDAGAKPAAEATPAPVPNLPDVRIRVSPGIAGMPNGKPLRLMSITAENHSSTPVFVSGFRINLSDHSNELALFFDSVTGRPVVPKRLEPGEAVSLNISRESFGDDTPSPEMMANAKIIDAIGREFLGDPKEFTDAIDELFGLER